MEVKQEGHRCRKPPERFDPVHGSMGHTHETAPSRKLSGDGAIGDTGREFRSPVLHCADLHTVARIHVDRGLCQFKLRPHAHTPV